MKKVLIWLVCLSILRGVAYIAVTPPWQAPDENTHFQFIELLTQRSLREIRRIDTFKTDDRYMELERKILVSMTKHRAWKYVHLEVPNPLPSAFWQAPFFCHSGVKIYRPPLYYLIGASILKFFNPESFETRLYIIRFFSLLLSLGSVVVSCLIGYLVFKDEKYALMTGAFVSFLPQFMVIGTSVNSENLVNLLSSVFLLYSIFIVDRMKSNFYLIPIPFLLLALFLSGKTAVGIAPVSLFLFAFQMGRSKRSLLILAISLLLLALFIPLVEHLVPGSMVAANLTLKWVLGSIYSGIDRGRGFYELFMLLLFKSFWFVGGWMQIYWNEWVYAGVGILCLLSGFGLVRTFWDRIAKKEENPSPSNPALVIFLLAALIAFGATLSFYGFVRGVLAQGRYLFPALLAFGVLFILGLKKMCPSPTLSYFPRAFIALMVCLDLYALLGWLLPYFHLR